MTHERLLEFLRSEGLKEDSFWIGPEHPKIENFIIELLRPCESRRFLEIGYQSGGTAVPVIREYHQSRGFHYVGIDNLAYPNAVSGALLGQFLRKEGVSDECFEFLTGDATVLLGSLSEPFDVILVDHLKPLYPDTTEAIIFHRLLVPDGVILYHDVLHKAEKHWRGCRRLLHKEGFRTDIIPDIPDGLAVARRTELTPESVPRPTLAQRIRRGLAYRASTSWARLLRMVGALPPAVGPRTYPSCMRQQTLAWLEQIHARFDRIVDIGAGSKPVTQFLKNTSWNEFVSIDVNESSHPDVVLDLSQPLDDASELRTRDDRRVAIASCDAAFAIFVLEHLHDPQQGLRNIAKLVRPGGLLYLAAPWIQPRHDAWDYYRFSEQALRRLCAGAGLEVVSLTPMRATLGRRYFRAFLHYEGLWDSTPNAPDPSAATEPLGYLLKARKPTHAQRPEETAL